MLFRFIACLYETHRAFPLLLTGYGAEVLQNTAANFLTS